jgi:hypothetical protein
MVKFVPVTFKFKELHSDYFILQCYDLLVVLGGRVITPSLEKEPLYDGITIIFIR